MPANRMDNLRALLFDKIFGLRRGEYVAVAWSFAYFFCVLSSYYMLRPIREAMGVESGVDTVPFLFTTTFTVMLLASVAFSFIASRFRRRQFLPWVYYFFAANMLAFYALFAWALGNEVDIVWIGRAFFVWISIFNLFVVSVFWSFMADIYTRAQGRRLFGFISAGGSAGALIGPFLTSGLVERIGFHNLLPISATLLLFAVVCIFKLRQLISSEATEEPRASKPKIIGGTAFAGITHVFKSNYFLAMVVMSVIASLLGTALYMFMNDLVAKSVEGVNARTQLFGYIDGATGIGAFIVQLLIVKHSVGKLGIGITLAFLPVLSLLGFAILAANPAILVIAVFQGLRRAIGFGFSKPSYDMLYSVVTPEEKYKAKNFIDTAVYRAGDVIGAWSVSLIWFLGISGIAIVMLPFALLWTWIGLWLGREYRRRDRSGVYNTSTAATETPTQ